MGTVFLKEFRLNAGARFLEILIVNRALFIISSVCVVVFLEKLALDTVFLKEFG